MPKFLDAPSWYDDDGNLKTIQGDFRISIGGGYGVAFDVPWVDGTNTSYWGHQSLPSQTYYLLPGSTTSGRIPYFSGATYGYQTLSSGTIGQVLTSNGSGSAPSWKIPSLYLHKIRIRSSNAVDVVANVYSMSSTSLTNNTISGLITFLTQKGCNTINNCLAAAGIVQASGDLYDAVAGIIAESSSYVSFVTYSTISSSAPVDQAELHSSVATSSATVTETIVSMS